MSIKKLKRLRDELKDSEAAALKAELISTAALPRGVVLTAQQITQRNATRDWLTTGSGATGGDDEF